MLDEILLLQLITDKLGSSIMSLKIKITSSSSSPCSLAGWGPNHLVASSTFVVNSLHLPLSSAMVFHSWPFIPALSRSRLTQSFHRSFGLPLHLLPPSSAFHALFDSLDSPILCTCPAHLILLPATFIFRCFFMPISSLNSFIFLLSSWVTLYILQTQLCSAICIFSSCLYVSASVPRLVTRRFPTLFLLVVSSVFCPTQTTSSLSLKYKLF